MVQVAAPLESASRSAAWPLQTPFSDFTVDVDYKLTVFRGLRAILSGSDEDGAQAPSELSCMGYEYCRAMR